VKETDQRKAQMRKYIRDRRERLRLAGMCIDCGKAPPIATAQRCEGCNQRMLDRYARSYEKRMGAEDPTDGAVVTLREIADELGMTHEGVRQILRKAMHKLRKACRKAGIDASDITGKPRSMLERAEDWA
jgi:hypothetical protein